MARKPVSFNKTESDVVKGVVKWFSPDRDYGFVIPNGSESNILLHGNVLRNFGRNSVADQSKIEMLVVKTERGIQATEVLRIEAPAADDSLIDPAIIAAADPEPARVKWFDTAKGYGFVNVFGDSKDVFLHTEVLRRSGLSSVQPGEAVVVKAIDSDRGRIAAEVHTWDSVLEEK